MVGGAALTREFTGKRIAPEYDGLVVYARDAMSGLDLANRLLSPELRAALEAECARHSEALAKPKPTPIARPRVPAAEVTPVQPLERLPEAPDFSRHVAERLPIDEVWKYLNPRMLYGKHLGLRGDPGALFEQGDPTALGLRELIDELKTDSRPGGAAPMKVSAVWQFFPAVAEGNFITLYDAEQEERVLAKFAFPRQSGGEQLCLADYVARSQSPGNDSIGLFAVTAGEGIRERYKSFRDSGEFLRSHAIQALAVETAEAAAEWLHDRLREDWGFPDPPTATMIDKFKARYRGRRYSFGFPACPELEKQVKLFELLRPEPLGITLTDEFMMDPEASVSAIVLHHPQAKYFSAGEKRLT